MSSHLWTNFLPVPVCRHMCMPVLVVHTYVYTYVGTLQLPTCADICTCVFCQRETTCVWLCAGLCVLRRAGWLAGCPTGCLIAPHMCMAYDALVLYGWRRCTFPLMPVTENFLSLHVCHSCARHNGLGGGLAYRWMDGWIHPRIHTPCEGLSVWPILSHLRIPDFCS